MRENKLGSFTNSILSFLDILIYFVIINTSVSLSENQIIFLNLFLVIASVILIVSMLSGDINPAIPRMVITVVYSSLCFISLFVNGSNYMMFQLMMMALGAVTLFLDKRALNLSMVLNCIMTVMAWMIPIPGVKYVFNGRDYLLNILILFCEYLVLYMVQGILQKKRLAEDESKQTVEELIKVIAAKREAALDANRAKSDFLANMSHEIRTPINAVLGFNEMILRENTDPNVKEFALDIRSSGNSLLSLINDILDFSKIEAGKMEILPVTYDLGSLLNDMINLIGFRATEKGLILRVDIDPSLPHILYGDEVRIKQVITNILTNAVKYTTEGYVDLKVDYEQIDDYQISLYVGVSDTGQGIKEEDIDKLFTPFERLDQVRNRNIEGSGLGIPLTCTLLNLMGSDLEVESAYGVGSTFSFRIRQEVENWEPIGSLNEALRRARKDTQDKNQYFIAPAARVLVVDDIPINIKVFRSLLTRTKIRIDAASNGMEALTMMRKTKYDVIFLDHMMPEMDGLETFERMKSDRFNVNRYETPVIALTANAVSGARELYIDKGFEDYLTKPIESVKLENMLIKYLDPQLVTMTEPDAADIPEAKPNEAKETTTPHADEEADHLLAALRRIPMIDVDAGIEASGGREIYEEVLRDYTETIEPYADRIEGFYNQRDVENYRIQVHALKSTSRMAGALRLSELARDLERAADLSDLEYIQTNTTELLRMYRELRAPLREAFGCSDTDEGSDLPEIETDMLQEAFTALREAVDSFDHDLIESVMFELENYSLPDKYANVYSRLKFLVAEVAYEDMAALLDKTMQDM